MPRSLLIALVGACLLAFLTMTAVLGHAELSSASPGPDEVIDIVPSELVARFSQDLRQDRTSIEVRDATGQTIARGGKDPDRARVQRAALPDLPPGTYEVRWVSFSAEDDEVERGRYTFSVIEVVATPSVPPSPGATACPAPAPSLGTGASPTPGLTSSPTSVGSLAPGSSVASTAEPSGMPTASPAPCSSIAPVPSPSTIPAPTASVAPSASGARP